MKGNNTHMTYITRILFVCCTLYACTRKHYVHTCKYKQEVVAMVKEIKYEFFFSSTCCFFFFFFFLGDSDLATRAAHPSVHPKMRGYFSLPVKLWKLRQFLFQIIGWNSCLIL